MVQYFFGKKTSINFKVKNVTPLRKKLHIMGVPIGYGATVDMLSFPGITESSIRDSLISGELAHKIRQKEIQIVSTSIDLLQFDAEQKAFIESAGGNIGIDPNKASKDTGTPYIQLGPLQDEPPATSFFFDVDGTPSYTDENGDPHALGGGGAGSQTLTETLALGNTSNGRDLIISTGDVITITDAPTISTDGVNKSYVDGYMASQATLFIKKDGSVAYTSDQSMGGNKVTNLGTPTVSTDAATKAYVDGYMSVPNTLSPRGSENFESDVYPSVQQSATINNSTSTTWDVAIAVGKRYQIVADVWVDDGAGGAVLFTKGLQIIAHQTGGSAVKVLDTTIYDNSGSGFTFTAAANTTNIRFTLANSSGNTRSYNIMIGVTRLDKP